MRATPPSPQVRDSGLDPPEPVLVLAHSLHPHADALVLAADLVDQSPRTLGLLLRLGDEALLAQPISPELVEWSVTINDPTTWTRPWTFAMNLTRGGAAQQPFEYACHEGNYGMENMLNAARKAERDAAAK